MYLKVDTKLTTPTSKDSTYTFEYMATGTS